MKIVNVIFGSLATVMVGTAGVATAGNAIMNDVSRFKGQPLSGVYKGGSWKIRFFRNEQFGNDDNKKCGFNDTVIRHWLVESDKEDFLRRFDEAKDNIGKRLVLIEFTKNWDLFGTSKTNVWFEAAGDRKDQGGEIETWKRQFREILNSMEKSPTDKVFAVLKDKNSGVTDSRTDLFVNRKFLLESLKLPTQKVGKCQMLKITPGHRDKV